MRLLCEAAMMVLTRRSPKLVKHRAGEGRSFPPKPHRDDLCMHLNVVCASCLSLYQGAAEATASHLAAKYNKEEKLKHLNPFNF